MHQAYYKNCAKLLNKNQQIFKFKKYLYVRNNVVNSQTTLGLADNSYLFQNLCARPASIEYCGVPELIIKIEYSNVNKKQTYIVGKC